MPHSTGPPGLRPSNSITCEAPKTWRLGDGFKNVQPHHAGIKALWETKWKFPCIKSLYPFHDGKPEDFIPVFEQLISEEINDPMKEAYTNAFIPPAEALAARAETASSQQERTELFLRACSLLRIARFPYIYLDICMNPAQSKAWALQKKFYLTCASTWEKPVDLVQIPFHNHTASESAHIPAFVRRGASPNAPVMLLLTGLDGYRPDNTQRLEAFLARGWGSVTVEIPGTADCPADPGDVTSPDRMCTSILDWIAEQDIFDAGQVLVWGLSAGGYYAARAAHTHAERIKGVVAQGAGIHHFFGKEWLACADGHEYPFELFPFLAWKYGFKDKEEYLEGAQAKFSLLETGILEMKSTKLLLVNGVNDGLMPIEDSILCLERGNAKSGRFLENRLHMGYPEANGAVYDWLDDLMGVKVGQ